MTGNFLQQEFVCFMYHLGRPLMSMLQHCQLFLFVKNSNGKFSSAVPSGPLWI